VYEDQKHIQEQINGLPANARPEGCMRLSMTIVPTLRVVTQRWTLRVTWATRMQAWENDAERRGCMPTLSVGTLGIGRMQSCRKSTVAQQTWTLWD
jgi:hypothetical protein